MKSKQQQKLKVAKSKIEDNRQSKRVLKLEEQQHLNASPIRQAEETKEFFKMIKLRDGALKRIEKKMLFKKMEGTSPFDFRKPAEGKQFLNCKEELERFSSELSGPGLLFIAGYEGTGKTSFALALAREIKRRYRNRIVVHVSLKGCTTEDELLTRYVAQVENALVPNIKIENPKGHLSKYNRIDLAELPEQLARAKEKRVVLILDDFDVITGMPDQYHIEGLLRSVWQNQKWVSMCVFMKRTSDMIALYGKVRRPFYLTGMSFILKGVQINDWYDYISLRFKKNSQHIGKEEVAYLVNKTKGVPKHVQKLAHYVFINGKPIITIEDIDAAFNNVVELDSTLYRKRFSKLTKFQKRVLIGCVKGKPLNIASRYIDKTYTAIEDLAIIWGANQYFLDPYFEHYFKKRTGFYLTLEQLIQIMP